MNIFISNLHGKEKVKLFPEFTSLKEKESVPPNVLITSLLSYMYKVLISIQNRLFMEEIHKQHTSS